MRRLSIGSILILLLAVPLAVSAQRSSDREGDYLYRVVTVRAAPGRLWDLVELYKEERDLLEDAGELLPYWMRHTQGDQWDLMLIYPMGSFHDYYHPDRVARRLAAGDQKGLSEQDLLYQAMVMTSWKDELFVRGPELEVLAREFPATATSTWRCSLPCPGGRVSSWRNGGWRTTISGSWGDRKT